MLTREHPIDLFFGGMEKFGPGSDIDTLNVLDLLPRRSRRLIVDAGCGWGRQTLALAGRLQVRVHGIDSYAPFLATLAQRAKERGIGHLVRVHCMDMGDIPMVFRGIDLLWSEGAAWHIGFSHALQTWHAALARHGFAVVSERSWLGGDIPAVVRRYFGRTYPEMQTVGDNRSAARDAGYSVLATYTLPAVAWMEGYYDVLEPRARELLGHPDRTVREYAAAMLEKIQIFGSSGGCWGYVFYVLRRE